MDKQVVIVAPHADDEIIGCFENLTRNPIIIYSDDIILERKMETKELLKYRNIKAQLFLRSIPSTFLNQNHEFFIPDPVYEIHPKHREWGHIGESMFRAGLDVTFYTTTMQAPYIHEVIEIGKKDLLDIVYPSQKSLWEFDHKYYLFEGYCKWMI